MKVSVIIPVLNAQGTFMRFLASLKEQNFNQEEVEYLFIDSCKGGTKVIIETTAAVANYRVIEESVKNNAEAYNLGIKEAQGEIIILMNTQCSFPEHYITNCVKALEAKQGNYIGAYPLNEGTNDFGKIAAKLLSSRFGVGNKELASMAESKEVDYVYLGCFYKEYINEIGGFNPDLFMNEEKELSYRIKQAGGKVFLSNDLHYITYPAKTLNELCKYAETKGKWNVITSKYIPHFMDLHRFLPLVFFITVAGCFILGFINTTFWLTLLLIIALYFSLAMVFASREVDNLQDGVRLTFLFPLFHYWYGYGTFKGLLCKK